MKTITIFLDDRNIFKDTLINYKYEEKLSESNIQYKYLNDLNDLNLSKDLSITNFNIVFIFLDTCWNKKDDDNALFKQIELIKNAASENANIKFLVFPYSTTFRDDAAFLKLYKQFQKKPDNITVDKEPFLIRKNSNYQMNGILSMIISKKSELENNEN